MRHPIINKYQRSGQRISIASLGHLFVATLVVCLLSVQKDIIASSGPEVFCSKSGALIFQKASPLSMLSPVTFAFGFDADSLDKFVEEQERLDEEEDDGPSLKTGVFGSKKNSKPPTQNKNAEKEKKKTQKVVEENRPEFEDSIAFVPPAVGAETASGVSGETPPPETSHPLPSAPPQVFISDQDLQDFLVEEVSRREVILPSSVPVTAGEHSGSIDETASSVDDEQPVAVTFSDSGAGVRQESITSSSINKSPSKRREEYFRSAEDSVRMALTAKPASQKGPISSRQNPLTPTSTQASKTLNMFGKRAQFTEAIRNYQASARRGHPLAMNRLAIFHAHGLGVAKSEAKAVLFHKFASFGGSVESSIALSHRHEHGIGVRPSTKAAAVYAMMASKLVSVSYHIDLKAEQHQVRLADEIKGLKMSSLPSSKLVGGKRYVNTRGMLLSADDVLQMFQVEADRGSPSALMFLGYAYLHGDSGVRRDTHRAVQLFKDALHDHSHAAAYGALGQIYVQGILTSDPPIQPDPRKALKYFTDGAKLDDPSSLNGLGYFYAKAAAAAGARDAFSLFNVKDSISPTPQILYERAYKCFSDAATHSNADALYNMAILAKHGHGTTKDNSRYLAFLRRAAAGGSVLARHHLGVHRSRPIRSLSEEGQSHLQALSDFKEVLNKGPWNRRLMRAYDAYHIGDYQTALLQYLMAAEIGDKLGRSNSLFMLQRSSGSTGTYGLGTESIQLRRFEYPIQSAISTTTAYTPTLISDQVAAAENFVVGMTLRLAKDGDKDAQLFLGDYYFSTTAPERDLLKKSLEHYRMAAEGDEGLAQANFNVGYMCQRGYGTPTDYHLSKRYYDRALQLSTSETAGDAYYAVNAALMSLNFQYWFDYFFDLAKKEDASTDVGPSLTRRAPSVPSEPSAGFWSSVSNFRVWLIRVGRLAPKVFGYPLDDVCLFSALVALGGLLALRNHIALN